MENVNFMACASSYLYSPPREIKPQCTVKKERKVEPTESTNNGKKFNKNADAKANFAQYLDYF